MAGGLGGTGQKSAEVVVPAGVCMATNIVLHTPGGHVLIRPADGGVKTDRRRLRRGGCPRAFSGFADRNPCWGRDVGRHPPAASAWACPPDVAVPAPFDVHSDPDGTVILVRVGPPPPPGGALAVRRSQRAAGRRRAQRGCLGGNLDSREPVRARRRRSRTRPRGRDRRRAATGRFQRYPESDRPDGSGSAKAAVAAFAARAHQAPGAACSACAGSTPAPAQPCSSGWATSPGYPPGEDGQPPVSHPGTPGAELAGPGSGLRPERGLLLVSDGIDTRWGSARAPAPEGVRHEPGSARISQPDPSAAGRRAHPDRHRRPGRRHHRAAVFESFDRSQTGQNLRARINELVTGTHPGPGPEIALGFRGQIGETVPADAAADLLQAIGSVLGELLGLAGRGEVRVEADKDLDSVDRL